MGIYWIFFGADGLGSGWFGATFLGRISLILGGLDPCPDGLGHFFGDEVPQFQKLGKFSFLSGVNF